MIRTTSAPIPWEVAKEGAPDSIQLDILPGLFSMLGGGPRLGEITVIASRPGMGKSSLAEQIAVSASKDCEVFFCGYEMGPIRHAFRMIQREHGFIPKTEAQYLAWTEDLRVWFMDLNSTNLEDLVRGIENQTWTEVIRHHDMEFETSEKRLFIIDFIQQMTIKNWTGSESSMLKKIMSTLARVAVKNHCAIVAVSQMNRGIEDQRIKRFNPVMSDVEGSGGIEQFAGAMLMPVRESVLTGKNPGEEEICNIYVPKNRWGEIGSARVKWVGSRLSYEEA